ncbi:universal stress protein [Phenylobacterium sp.]|jgi:nucleotide-binding universal stress UspA family protein|uniref:universal stress protein n=1 Tax=Phenylobacterium sp. TaxID=1871053 RepID=UPI002F3F45FD
MYKRILLASDGAQESLVALREGALVARAHGARVFLLIVQAETQGIQMASGIHPVVRDTAALEDLLALGQGRLRRLGVANEGKMAVGDPAVVIAQTAWSFRADLIVVGHRRLTLLERWWSGDSGGYLIDRVNCSVLVARNVISDAEFEAHMMAASKGY